MMDRRDFVMGLIVAGSLGAGTACSPGMARTGSEDANARSDLYACEGCEAVGERQAESLGAVAILAGPSEAGERMRLRGRVLAADGITPAVGVVIYAHHTNAQGLYADGASDTVWSRRHGRLRGWARTGPDGLYAFDTIKPAPYPDMNMPAHVHLFIGEPGRRPYYIDDVVFDGEFAVDAAYRERQELRGGSGIVRLARGSDGGLDALRNIRLEPHPV